MQCYCGESHGGSFDSALDALAETPDVLARVVRNLGKHESGRRPGHEARSILEIVVRLKNAELAASVHYRQMLAETTPDLFPFDPDRWLERLHDYGKEAPVSDGVDFVRLLRADNVRLLRSLEPRYRQHEGWHPVHGSITLEALVIHLAAQEADLLQQLR